MPADNVHSWLYSVVTGNGAVWVGSRGKALSHKGSGSPQACPQTAAARTAV